MGNAISRGNPEAEFVLDKKLRYCSLPELLKEFFIRGKRSIVVSGTHGKTTTTSLLTWVFEHNGLNPSYLIGGIPNNFSAGRALHGQRMVHHRGRRIRHRLLRQAQQVRPLPAGDRHHQQPRVRPRGHFRERGAIQTAFKRFINLIPRNGQLLANGDDPNLAPLLNVTHCPVKRFGLGEGNAWRADKIVLAPTVTEFEMPSFKFRLNLLGELNVRNALGVIAAARHCGLKNHQIQEAFDTFKGVKRRMEVRGVSGGVTVVDDFGHHPTAIRETLRALRVNSRASRSGPIFEPRTNTTRRNVFQSELAESFVDADAVVISQIARLELLQAGERLDPERLDGGFRSGRQDGGVSAGRRRHRGALGKGPEGGDVVCVFSNGGFGGIHGKLLERLNYAGRK